MEAEGVAHVAGEDKIDAALLIYHHLCQDWILLLAAVADDSMGLMYGWVLAQPTACGLGDQGFDILDKLCHHVSTSIWTWIAR